MCFILLKVPKLDLITITTMKVLSVQQPWASLIVAGIKDVENRTWKPSKMPGRILIHASKKTSLRAMGNEPLEWVQEIFNEQDFGNLPDFPDMPDGAIIGYATVEAVDHDNARSIWASGDSNIEGLWYWHMTDAHIFDEPITGVKGKLHLWDYDLDEDNLPPAHKLKLNNLTVDGDNVNVPLVQTAWDNLAPNDCRNLELGMVADLLCNEGVFTLRPFKTITFFHGNEKRKFMLKPETDAMYFTKGNDSDEPAKYLSILLPEGAERWIARFVWGDEVL